MTGAYGLDVGVGLGLVGGTSVDWMRVTVEPDEAELFPGGSWAATWPFLGHSALNCVSSEMTGWNPAFSSSDWAFPRDSQTTSGTVTCCGPDDTTMSTVEPLFTVCPAGGDWPMTSPAGAGSACGVTVPTFRPASVIADLAASSVKPPRLGTSTCFGALPTVIVTVLPFSRSVPATGLCSITIPTSLGLLVTRGTEFTRKPASIRSLRAASSRDPTTPGTFTEAALVLSRLDASRYSPPPRTARISKTISAGIHHLL